MRIHRSLAAVLLCASAMLAACTVTDTLTYRDIQSEFNQAVQADNQVAVQPFTGSVSTSLYQGVSEQLTDGYIATLDPRLQPNAWLLRSVAEWRTGDFTGAENSAQRGINHPDLNENSRDDVVLRMIPALVSESFVGQELQQAPEISPARYESDFANDLNRASRALSTAKAATNEATPADVQYYLDFQVWRLIQNWNIVIGRIAAEADERNEVRDAAKQRLNEDGLITGDGSLTGAAASLAETIPSSHPLKALIEVLSRQ